MNITLIQPFTDNFEPPKSLAWIAASLRKAGHDVRLIDLQQCQVRNRWHEIFNSEQVDLVGVSAMTAQVRDVHEIAKWVKESASRDIPVVIGGAHPTFLPKQTLEEFPCFDYAVVGEGDLTIVELVERLEKGADAIDETIKGIAYRSDKGVVVTPRRPRIKDLDSLPNHHVEYDFDFYLDHNTFGFSQRCASLIVSRGCPFSCRFCATKNMWSTKYIHMSTDAVIEEIRYVMGRGAESIKFRDSTFNINRKWVYELCEKIIREKLKFTFAINARADLVDYDLFRILRKAGLRSVFFGVESGSRKILDFYGKGITPEQTIKAFEICHKLRIRTGAYWMIGALPETRKDMEETYDLAKKIRADQSLVFIFMPLPGSHLYQYYIDQGFKFDYDRMRSDKASFSCDGMSLDELEKMRQEWYDDLNRPKNLLVRAANIALDIRSFRDFKLTMRRISKKIANG